MAIYVLDTTAMLAYVRNEPGADDVEDVLRRADEDSANRVLVPFIALMEFEYILLREMVRDDVEENLSNVLQWPVHTIESTVNWRRAAALVKSRGKLSLADAWVAALALINDAELVHKDPEFDDVPGLKATRLPYDRDLRLTT